MKNCSSIKPMIMDSFFPHTQTIEKRDESTRISQYSMQCRERTGRLIKIRERR